LEVLLELVIVIAIPVVFSLLVAFLVSLVK